MLFASESVSNSIELRFELSLLQSKRSLAEPGVVAFSMRLSSVSPEPEAAACTSVTGILCGFSNRVAASLALLSMTSLLLAAGYD